MRCILGNIDVCVWKLTIIFSDKAKSSLTDTLLFKNWVGVIFLQCGYAKILNMILMLQ